MNENLCIKKERFDIDAKISIVTPVLNHPSNLREFINIHQKIREKQVHIQSQNDLVKYLRGKHDNDLN